MKGKIFLGVIVGLSLVALYGVATGMYPSLSQAPGAMVEEVSTAPTRIGGIVGICVLAVLLLLRKKKDDK